MVDVRRNDRPTPRHFIPYKLRRDLPGNRSSPRLTGMLETQLVARALGCHLHLFAGGLQLHVFPDRHKFHFRRDDSLPRIVQLGNRSPLGTAGLTPPTRKLLLARAVAVALAVVLRTNLPPWIRLGVSPLLDPCRPRGGQPLPDVRGKVRIPPGSARVVDAHRVVGLQAAVRLPRGLKFNFPERHPQIGPGSVQINPSHALDGVKFLDLRHGKIGAHRTSFPRRFMGRTKRSALSLRRHDPLQVQGSRDQGSRLSARPSGLPCFANPKIPGGRVNSFAYCSSRTPVGT